jgi:HEPN domain-containing protein
MREETKWWLKQSEADLRSAKNSLKSKDYHTSVFSIHQAVEKSLKALYINRKTSAFMKSHNLLQFGKALEMPAPHMNFLVKLSPEYMLSRYPDASYGVPAERYTEEIVKEYLSQGEQVIKWAKSQIKE